MFYVNSSKNDVCDIVAGFDFNAMYLNCFAKTMLGVKLFYRIETNTAKLCDMVVCNRFFGFLLVDFEVPEELWDLFCRFPPLFFNVEVPSDCCGEYMKKLIDKLNNKDGQLRCPAEPEDLCDKSDLKRRAAEMERRDERVFLNEGSATVSEEDLAKQALPAVAGSAGLGGLAASNCSDRELISGLAAVKILLLSPLLKN